VRIVDFIKVVSDTFQLSSNENRIQHYTLLFCNAALRHFGQILTILQLNLPKYTAVFFRYETLASQLRASSCTHTFQPDPNNITTRPTKCTAVLFRFETLASKLRASSCTQTFQPDPNKYYN
jgi:hypothetical protein